MSEHESHEGLNREQAYLHMLDAANKIQWNIAMILEAKAVEAEKVRNWIINHISPDAFTTHFEQLHQPLALHEQMVELIDGLTKLGNGLSRHLKAILDQGNSSEDSRLDGSEGEDGLTGFLNSSFDFGEKQG